MVKDLKYQHLNIHNINLDLSGLRKQLVKDSSIKEPLLLLSLLKVKGIGPSKIVNWVLNCGCKFDKCLNSLSSLLTNEQLNIFAHNIKDVINEIQYNKSLGISIITIFDKNFPSKLYTSTAKCIYLYYKGNINLLNKSSVAIIGSRQPQNKMIIPGQNITKELCSKYVIVSGLAIGCDTIAHQTSLNNKGATIAVLPCPIYDIIPRINNNLANEIVNNNGLLVSEYGSKIKQMAKRYIDRDRIQSLLSNFVVVLDADANSGTRYAVEKSIHDNKPFYQLNGSRMTIISNNIIDIKDIKLEL